MATTLNFHPLTGQPVLPLGVTKRGRVIWPVMGGNDTVTPVTEPIITVPVTVEPVPSPTFTAADLERVRKEEKDKLYPTIETLKKQSEEFERFKSQQEAALTAAAEEAASKARAEAAEAARKEWEEKGAKDLLQNVQQEWEQKFTALQQQQEQERAAFAKEQEFAALTNYIQKRAGEEAGKTIAPELVDLISGNTPDEVEASITNLQGRSAAIMENIQRAAVEARSQMRGVSTAGFSTSGPLDTNSGTKSFSAADISAMPMSEYAKHRGSLLTAASAQQNRGLFG